MLNLTNMNLDTKTRAVGNNGHAARVSFNKVLQYKSGSQRLPAAAFSLLSSKASGLKLIYVMLVPPKHSGLYAANALNVSLPHRINL